jgi:hypothetical protein
VTKAVGVGGDPRVDPRRVAALPSMGRLAGLGIVVTIVPGIVVFVIFELAGLSTGSAGGLGLLAMIIGMAWYPTYLRKLGKRLDAQMKQQP